jgi:hypothetical protein
MEWHSPACGWPGERYTSFGFTHLPYEIFDLVPCLLSCFLCMYLTFPPLEGFRPILFFLSEGSSGLQVSVVLRTDILQLDHASIHGGG